MLGFFRVLLVFVVVLLLCDSKVSCVLSPLYEAPYSVLSTFYFLGFFPLVFDLGPF